ncbi:MAG TPA: DUF1127 domain-containing protein [Thermohalobaculum sp.]|nr:DUF1127 domain-containing protein [Thermohalobaculum sp.]
MTETTCHAAHKAAAANPLAAVARAIGGAVRRLRREIEIERAARQLAALPDAMLRDMGIDRYAIDFAVRQGRREHGRRYP